MRGVEVVAAVGVEELVAAAGVGPRFADAAEIAGIKRHLDHRPPAISLISGSLRSSASAEWCETYSIGRPRVLRRPRNVRDIRQPRDEREDARLGLDGIGRGKSLADNCASEAGRRMRKSGGIVGQFGQIENVGDRRLECFARRLAALAGQEARFFLREREHGPRLQFGDLAAVGALQRLRPFRSSASARVWASLMPVTRLNQRYMASRFSCE